MLLGCRLVMLDANEPTQVFTLTHFYAHTHIIIADACDWACTHKLVYTHTHTHTHTLARLHVHMQLLQLHVNIHTHTHTLSNLC